ncbi:MAG: Uma2 family endonuclease [Fibrella sp.]|nr:Uma2 family endonuclease [Armatimonadota bacterium]
MITRSEKPIYPTPIRWTRDEYHRLGESGVFGERRVELLEGAIIEMSPVGRRHWVTTNLVAEALEQAFGNGYFVSVQSPIYLSTSEPEPDVAVLRGSPRDYADTQTTTLPELVVEVADTSLEYDRRQKKAIYAHAGIGEYWIVSIESQTVEVRRQPDTVAGIYNIETMFGCGETITPISLPGVAIAVDDLLP